MRYITVGVGKGKGKRGFV